MGCFAVPSYVTVDNSLHLPVRQEARILVKSQPTLTHHDFHHLVTLISKTASSVWPLCSQALSLRALSGRLRALSVKWVHGLHEGVVSRIKWDSSCYSVCHRHCVTDGRCNMYLWYRKPNNGESIWRDFLQLVPLSALMRQPGMTATVVDGSHQRSNPEGAAGPRNQYL